MATDTAFVRCVLALIRKHIPTSLLAFLVGLAIVDDVGAYTSHCIVHTQEISVTFLLISFALIAFWQ